MKPILEMNLKEYDEYLKSICCPDPNCGVFPGQYHDELCQEKGGDTDE